MRRNYNFFSLSSFHHTSVANPIKKNWGHIVSQFCIEVIVHMWMIGSNQQSVLNIDQFMFFFNFNFFCFLFYFNCFLEFHHRINKVNYNLVLVYTIDVSNHILPERISEKMISMTKPCIYESRFKPQLLLCNKCMNWWTLPSACVFF